MDRDSLRIQPSPAVADVPPYATPPLPANVQLKLDGNEGPPPAARMLEALARLNPEVLRRYPNARPLEAMIAERWTVEPEQVLVTAGADEALERMCRAVLSPGRQMILPSPTFEMLPRYVRLSGGEPVTVPWTGEQFPTEAVVSRISKQTAVIAVVSPNNPTGLTATATDLRAVAAAAPGALVLADLAYADFADEDLTSIALSLPNALTVRSFSKAWGLAGLRVGYAIGPPKLIHWLRAAGGPYSVAGPSLALAAEWLAHGEETVRTYVRRIREERSTLAEHLRRLGVSVAPSQANFVFARFADAERVWQTLLNRGIAVRRFTDPELAGALRITCPGNAADLDRLLGAFSEILPEEMAK